MLRNHSASTLKCSIPSEAAALGFSSLLYQFLVTFCTSAPFCTLFPHRTTRLAEICHSLCLTGTAPTIRRHVDPQPNQDLELGGPPPITSGSSTSSRAMRTRHSFPSPTLEVPPGIPKHSQHFHHLPRVYQLLRFTLPPSIDG